MSRCKWCRGDGLVFLRYRESPGYDVAACQCAKGEWWRQKWQLRAWASVQQPKPDQIGRLEEFFTEDELRTLTTVEGAAPIAVGARPIAIRPARKVMA